MPANLFPRHLSGGNRSGRDARQRPFDHLREDVVGARGNRHQRHIAPCRGHVAIRAIAAKRDDALDTVFDHRPRGARGRSAVLGSRHLDVICHQLARELLSRLAREQRPLRHR